MRPGRTASASVGAQVDIEAVLRTRPPDNRVEEPAAIGLPAGAVLTVPEMLVTDQVADRGFVKDVRGRTRC